MEIMQVVVVFISGFGFGMIAGMLLWEIRKNFYSK